jgi:asparagine synthase (glutamine-hydrolysing)
MCGVAGIASANGVTDAGDRIGRMARALERRGPDAEGTWISRDGRVALGHRRLAIIACGPRGAQPMTSRDGSVTLAFNGEIYNYRDLASKEDAQDGDTRALVEAWARDGVAALPRLRGIFAFAAYDHRTGHVWLVRDRLGIKPMYHSIGADGVLVFGSEIKAVLASGMVDPAPDADAIISYRLLRAVPGCATAYAHIRQVPPGSALCWEAGLVRTTSWWSVCSLPAQREDAPADACDRVRALVDQAVRRQLESERPMGLLLSGGLDSGAIAASAAARADIRAFTVSFGGANQGDVDGAHQTARHLGIALEQVSMPEGSLPSEIEAMLDAHDQPFSDAAGVPIAMACRMLRSHAVVLLQGDGGDEVFGGYATYSRVLWAKRASAAWRLASALLSVAPGGRARKLRRIAAAMAMPADLVLAALNSPCSPGMPSVRGLGPALQDAVGRTDPMSHYRHVSDGLRALDPVTQAIRTDIATQLHDRFLPKVDRASMHESVEVRVPLLDEDLLDYVATLPASALVHGSRTKVLFREAMRPRLPSTVIAGAKRGFAVPVDAWMRGALHDCAQSLFASREVRDAGMVDPKVALADLARHRSGSLDCGEHLLSLLMLAKWSVMRR